MAVFDWLTTATKEKRTMLYFKENGHFKFQKMDVEDTFLLEKKNGRVTRAWEDMRKLRLPFHGWKGIPRDAVTLAHSRDVIYDPFSLLSPTEKPTGHISAKTQARGIDAWISDVTQTQQYKRQEECSKKMAQTTQIILLSIPAILMGIGVLIVILVNMNK